MPRLFGTDGVRGLAGRDITACLALNLAAAAARELTSADPKAADDVARHLRAVVGVDSRVSGDMLAAACAAGLASAGVNVTQAGVIPTPGLAYLTRTGGFDLGVMISASHNPYPDNGIKFFAGTGYKLPDAVEDRIEARLEQGWDAATGAAVGRTMTDPAADQPYIDALVAAASGSLAGLKVVLDCANGAAYHVAPAVFERLGATVVALANQPDGVNINDQVGSTHPEALQQAVVANQADMGFAFDGDADRCLAVDAAGQLVDGDQIMGILALSLKAEGRLSEDTLVTTVMSNLGLFKAMEAAGVTTVQTAVGDRYVLEAMLAGGYALGGEQSGHIIMTEHATTGDGTLTAVQLACRVAGSGRPLSELASVVQAFPQVLINVGGVDKARAGTDPGVLAGVDQAEAELGESGRVLLRPSGTEPLVRVMVEAATEDQANAVAQALAATVTERLALPE